MNYADAMEISNLAYDPGKNQMELIRACGCGKWRPHAEEAEALLLETARAEIDNEKDAVRMLLGAEFRFAKTMPKAPHFYTLRDKWAESKKFIGCVQFIRDNGYRSKHWGRIYTYFEIDECRYWSMGFSLGSTILVNRAETPT